MVILESCIWELLGSNLGQETVILTDIFMVFLIAPLDQDHFRPDLFEFINHLIIRRYMV
jgi:hypothetical protein